jgi:hypothetical protein
MRRPSSLEEEPRMMQRLAGGTVAAFVGLVTLVGAQATPQPQTPQAPQTPPAAQVQKLPDTITLTGCLRPGTTPNSYVLTNVMHETKPAGTAGATTVPSRPMDAEDAPLTYRLESGDAAVDLGKHVNRKVEVSGTLKMTDAKVPSAKPMEDAAKEKAPAGTDIAKNIKTFTVKTLKQTAESCT